MAEHQHHRNLSQAFIPTLTGRRHPRRDGLPEAHKYQDEGCDLHASCLTCPFETCRYDLPRQGGRSIRIVARRMRVRELFDAGKSIDEMARETQISRRAIFRDLESMGLHVKARDGDVLVHHRERSPGDGDVGAEPLAPLVSPSLEKAPERVVWVAYSSPPQREHDGTHYVYHHRRDCALRKGLTGPIRRIPTLESAAIEAGLEVCSFCEKRDLKAQQVGTP